MSTIASAYVAVLPEMGGFSSALLRGIGKVDAAKAGQVLGQEVGRGAETGLASRSRNVAKAGAALFAGVGVGAAIVGVQVIKMAATFQQNMERIHTQAGVAQSAIKPLGDQILAMTSQVGVNANTLADQLYHVESSFASTGITGAKAMELVRVAAEGAKISGASAVDTQNALDAAVKSGISGASNYSQAMGALNATVGSGDMKMQDLNQALSTGLLVTMKQFGLSLPDVGAGLADLGDNNIRGAEAATKLRMAVMALASPAKLGLKSLQAIGIGAKQLGQDMEHGGLLKALEDLKQHMDAAKIPAKERGQFITEAFGKKAGAGILILIGTLDNLKSKYPELTKQSGDFVKAWQAQSKTFQQKADDLKQGVDAIGIALGTKLMPYAQKALDWAIKFIQQMQSGHGSGGQFAADMTNVGHAIQNIFKWISQNQTLVKTFAETLATFWAANKVLTFLGFLGKVKDAWIAIRVQAGLAGAAEATAGARGAVGGAAGSVAKGAGAAEAGAAAGGAGLLAAVGGPQVVIAALAAGTLVAASWLKGFKKKLAESGADKKPTSDFAKAQSDMLSSSLGTGLKGVGEGLKIAGGNLVHDVAQGFAAGFGVLLRAGGQAVHSIAQGSAAGFGVLQRAGGQAVHYIAQGFAAAFGVLQRAVITVMGAVHVAWNASWNALRGPVIAILQSIRNTVVSILHSLTTSFAPALNFISSHWTGTWQTMQAVTSAVLGFIRGIVSSAMHAITGSVSTGGGAMSGVWSHVWSVIRAILDAAWGAIRSVVHIGMSSVTAVISVGMSVARSVWTVAWGVIRSITATVMGAIRSAVSVGMGAIRAVITTTNNIIQSAWTGTWNTIKSITSTVMGALQGAVSTGLNAVKSMFSNTVSAIGSIWSTIVSKITGPIHDALSFVQSKLLGPLNTITSKFGINIPHIPGFAEGGPIYGAGTATSDSIPAMLSHGEYVINAKSTGQFRDLLDKINSGNLSKFAGGGAAPGPSSYYVNPLAGGNWGLARTDQGVDYMPNGPQTVRSVGAGTVMFATLSSGWPGGGWISYKLSDGPEKGQNVYTAEHLTNLRVHPGQHINAGQPLATALPGYPWTEWGWAGSGSGQVASAYNGSPDGTSTAGGKDFARFMRSVGAQTQQDPGKGPVSPGGGTSFLGGIGNAIGGFLSHVFGDLMKAFLKGPAKLLTSHIGTKPEIPNHLLTNIILKVFDAASSKATSADAANSSSGGGGVGGPGVGGAGAKGIWDNLISQGFNAFAAAGVMGNMMAESSLNPFEVESGGTSMNPAAAGSGGYGLVQWTPGSKLIPFLHGAAPSIQSEVRAVKESLPGSIFSAMQQSSNAASAAQIYELQYEKHAGGVQPARASWAMGYYNQFAKAVAPTAAQMNAVTGAQRTQHRAMGGPIYHQGTPWVPETGWAMLQRGEAVIPAKHNPANGGGGGTPNITVHVTLDGHRIDDKVEIAIDNHATSMARALSNGRSH